MKTCATCQWWKQTGTLHAPLRRVHDMGVKLIPPGNTGECRAQPPTTDHTWPETHETEHCGLWCEIKNFDAGRTAEHGAAYSPTSPSTAEAARPASFSSPEQESPRNTRKTRKEPAP